MQRFLFGGAVGTLHWFDTCDFFSCYECVNFRIVFCSRQKVMKGERAQEFRHPQKKKNKKRWIQGALSCCAEKPGGQVQNRQEEEAPERICCCRVVVFFVVAALTLTSFLVLTILCCVFSPQSWIRAGKQSHDACFEN